MMSCAILSILIMTDKEDMTFILLPIAMLVWGIYSFFEPNDKEHIRRSGYGNNSWTSYDYYDYPYKPTKPITRNSTYISNKQYKPIVTRCKRSVKITLNDNDTNKPIKSQ